MNPPAKAVLSSCLPESISIAGVILKYRNEKKKKVVGFFFSLIGGLGTMAMPIRAHLPEKQRVLTIFLLCVRYLLKY